MLATMSFDTICDVSFAALYVLVLGVPAWFVFYPPRRVRSWPWFCRPILAVVCAQLGTYALFYAFVYPASRAYLRAHPSVLCGILCVQPSGVWVAIAIVTGIFFLLYCCYLAVRKLTSP
jgi:hypothetical protein